ncbi:MAG: hydantoinase B/oxoprolinase family protein [Wenzhouxiangellaceae bacterium]
MNSTVKPETNSAGTIDPIALSIFASRTMAIAEEMGAHLGRTALSANIRDRRDYSCALFDASGELVAQATHIPVHLGSMAYAMQGLAGSREWSEGDALILNDPYQGGTHLPDVTLIVPVFCERQLLGFCACRAHYADIGAGETGSMGIATRLQDEGVLIAPSLLYRQGDYQGQVLQPLLQRVRAPAQVHGDARAQLSACRYGADRLRRWCETLGVAGWRQRVAALQDYAERLSRAALVEIPTGRYHFEDVLDDDGCGHSDIPIRVAVTVADGDLQIDFAGTSEQVEGNLNCPLSVTAAAVFYVVRCLLPAATPLCAGCLRPVTFSAPAGSLLNATAPAAVAAGNVETSSRVVDVLLGALATALPRRIPAASQGTMNNLAMAGDGWSYYETIAGGCGASAQGDGASAQHSHMTNTLNTPVEILERLYPMRVNSYELRHGSGGDGDFRGGDGLVREYEFLAAATIAVVSERRQHGPWGLQGGDAGAVGENRLDDQLMPGKFETRVKAGQRLTIATPGGGGYCVSGKLDNSDQRLTMRQNRAAVRSAS